MNFRNLLSLGALAVVFGSSAVVFADQKVKLEKIEVPAAVGRSKHLGHSDPNRILHVAVSMPFADPEGMQKFADSVSDPSSPNYQKFLTPEEVGARFGLSDDKVKAVEGYLKSQGFKVNMVGKNHLTILADCSVEQAETAFSTRIEDFKAIDAKDQGRASYYSFVESPSVPAEISKSILAISGLENFTRPKARTTLTPAMTRVLYNVAPTYSTYKGQGRTVAISNFDGFRLTNLPIFYSKFGLPTPPGGVGSNVQVVTINGGSGSGAPAGEGDLDIQMVLGQAPFCNLIIYDGTDIVSCLAREANDNAADIISESYGWIPSLTDTTAAHNLHVSMTAQGITYTLASGDAGTDFLGFDYPNYDPEVLIVGGTVASTDSTGKRTSEVGWSGSGGGWSTVVAPYNVRPSWQKGNGVPNINFRLNPDVAIHADSPTGGGYFIIYNGAQTGISGTSCSSPVFAGALALVEQREMAKGYLPANSKGKRRAGRLQDLIYSQNGKASMWLDITQGSNGTLPNGQIGVAKQGWDFVTGWGVPNWDNFNFIKGVALPMGLSFMSITEGTLASGDPIGSTGAADGSFFSIRPVFVANLGSVGSATYRSVLPTTVPRANVFQMDFTIVGRYATTSTGQLYLFNFGTGKWDIAKSFALSTTASTNIFSLKSAFTSYISAAGEARFMVRGLRPASAGVTNNTVDFDRVSLVTSYNP